MGELSRRCNSTKTITYVGYIVREMQTVKFISPLSRGLYHSVLVCLSSKTRESTSSAIFVRLNRRGSRTRREQYAHSARRHSDYTVITTAARRPCDESYKNKNKRFSGYSAALSTDDH